MNRSEELEKLIKKRVKVLRIIFSLILVILILFMLEAVSQPRRKTKSIQEYIDEAKNTKVCSKEDAEKCAKYDEALEALATELGL